MTKSQRFVEIVRNEHQMMIPVRLATDRKFWIVYAFLIERKVFIKTGIFSKHILRAVAVTASVWMWGWEQVSRLFAA